MKISELGGEFELIKRLIRPVESADVIKGVGDDCAVLAYGDDKYLLVTTDMMVENDHFSLKWSTPYQIGKKLMEVNVSDIAAMAGKPESAFVSMSLTKDTSVEFMDELYRGLYDSAKKHGVNILGGDTTHGTELVFNMCLLGKVSKDGLRLRSGANVGDIICVTGCLGGSTAGLRLLLKGKGNEGNLREHLEPVSRTFDDAKLIGKYATAMIDVSDGLASEVKHICDESSVGAEIYYEKIPISKETKKSAAVINEDAYDYALYGGEDFELVFSIPKDSVELLEKELDDFSVVGRIVDQENGVCIIKDSQKISPKNGFDHFG